jgi:pilus assembly protein CpaB
MKPKTVVLLAVAVGSGLMAMLGVQQAMSGSGAKEETVKVLVALEDIDVGVQLTDSNVEFRELPISSLPDDPVTSLEQYEKRSPTYALKRDDIIRVAKLSQPGAFGKSLQIPEGMRVVSIPVDDTQTVSGLLTPGDRVDVVVTYTHRDHSGRQVTKAMTLLEYCEIFATDDRTARESQAASAEANNKTRIVSLLVTPEQVNYVKLAESKGKLSLSWRHRSDDAIVAVKAIDQDLLEELRGLPQGGWDKVPGFGRGVQPLYGDLHGEVNEMVTQNEPEPEPNVGEFLDQVAQESPPVAIAAAPETPKPTWSMQIYVGNEARTQEFELPQEEDNSASEGVEQVDVWKLLKQAI